MQQVDGWKSKIYLRTYFYNKEKAGTLLLMKGSTATAANSKVYRKARDLSSNTGFFKGPFGYFSISKR